LKLKRDAESGGDASVALAMNGVDPLLGDDAVDAPALSESRDDVNALPGNDEQRGSPIGEARFKRIERFVQELGSRRSAPRAARHGGVLIHNVDRNRLPIAHRDGQRRVIRDAKITVSIPNDRSNRHATLIRPEDVFLARGGS
jgi:hypothetical protein